MLKEVLHVLLYALPVLPEIRSFRRGIREQNNILNGVAVGSSIVYGLIRTASLVTATYDLFSEVDIGKGYTYFYGVYGLASGGILVTDGIVELLSRED